MGMHEGIERSVLQTKTISELVDIIMDMRYGEGYTKLATLPWQKCKTCGAERQGVSEVNLAHTLEPVEADADGHYISIKAKRTWCYGPWEFMKEG